MSGELLGTAVLELATDNRGLTTGMARARGTVATEGAAMQTSIDKRLVSVGQSVNKVGSTLTRGVTLPLVGAGVAAADFAVKFQQKMELIHTQAGDTQAAVGRLSKEVLDLARSGKVAAGPNDLADALFRLEGAGLKGKQAMDALTASAQLAAVGNASVEDTAKTLAQTWFVGIKGAGTFRDTVAQLNATVGAGDLRLQQLVDALGTGVVTSAKQVGLTLQDVTGVLAVFGDETNNVSGWAAQFATSLHFLTNPTNKAIGSLEDIGLKSTSLAVDLHKPQGLVTALGDLKDHLDKLPGGLHGVKADQVLGNIFPGGRGRVLLVLLNQLDRLQQKMGQIKKTSNQFTADVAKTQETAAFKIHASIATIESDAITFGTKILPPLLAVGKDVVAEADKIATAFAKLPPGVQKEILTGGLIAAGIGPALKIAGLFTSGMGTLLKVSDKALKVATLGAFGKGGGVSGSSINSRVATMEVGTLIAKSMVGGGAGGAGSIGANGARAAERDAEKTTGPKSLGKFISSTPGGLVALATGAGLVYGGSAVVHAFAEAVSPGSTTTTTHSLLQALGLEKPDLKPAINPGFKGAPAGTPTAIPHGFTGQLPANTHARIGGVQTDMVNAVDALNQLDNRSKKLGQNIFTNLANAAKASGDVKWQFADELGAQIVKSHTVTSKGVKTLIADLNKLPPAARTTAAQGMIEMAQQLEEQGKLPKNATDKLRRSIVGSYSTMRTQAAGQYQKMGTAVFNETDKIVGEIEGHYPPAIKAASTAFFNFATNVRSAMSTGTIATAKGTQIITDALNQILKSFGEKPIGAATVKGATPAQLAGLASGQVSSGAVSDTGGGNPGHAGGGIVQFGRPGDKGRDTIPVNFGGKQIVVGSGEQGMVLTGQQQAFLNARTADVGGLQGVFRKVNTRHYMAGGGFVPGFAGGGPVGYGQLEGLWDAAGGPKNMAALMAAIAEAESHGDPNAHNNSGASGLWQILGLPFPGNPFDPLTNARMALAKFRSQGLGAWVTYTSGAYKQFLNGAVPALGGSFGQISAPGVKGTGTIADIVRGALGLEAKGANSFLSKLQPTGGIGGVGPSGGSFSASQLGSFDGLRVADWIIPELMYAQAHGWKGRITSGYRAGFDPHAPSGSEHALDVYPGGAVDFGGMVDPAGLANRAAFMAAVAGYPGAQKLIPATGFRDDGHMSGTGHSAGGILGLAGGGFATDARKASKPGANFPWKRKKPPTIQDSQWKPIDATGTPGIDQALATLNGLLGDSGDIASLQDRYQQTDALFQALHPDLNYVVSQDANGNPVTPFIDWALGPDGQPIPDLNSPHAVNLSLGELDELYGWQSQIVGDYQRAMNLIPHVLKLIAAAIKERQRKMEALKAQIRKNLAKVAKLQKDAGQTDPNILKLKQEINSAGTGNQSLTSLRRQLATAEAIEVPSGSKGDKARAARDKLIGSLEGKITQSEHGQRVSVAGLRNELLGVEAHDKDRKSGLTDQIKAIEKTNQQLGGDATKIGTGGQLGTLAKQVQALQGHRSDLTGDQLTIAGASGIGGELGSAKVNLATLSGQIGQLSPTVLGQQLSQASSASTPTGPDLSAQLALETQLATTNAQTAAVLRGELDVLSHIGDLPPFGGSFATGGIVPGPIGAARTVIAHGGEKVTPVGGGDRHQFHVIVHDGAVDTRKIEVIADGVTQRATRVMARNAINSPPSRGGGRR